MRKKAQKGIVIFRKVCYTIIEISCGKAAGVFHPKKEIRKERCPAKDRTANNSYGKEP